MDAVRDDGHCPQLANAVGHALYALEPEDEHAVRTHLPTCPVCQDAVRATEQAAARIGASVQQHEPPPALRQRLLAAIDTAPRLMIVPVVEPPIDLAARRHSRRTRGLVAAAAAAALVLGGATAVLGVQVGHLTGQQQAQAAADSAVRAITESPAAKRAVLTNAAGKTAAILVTSSSGAVVIPLGLAPNAASQQYVAWGLPPTGPQALTSFDVTAGDVGPKLLSWPKSAGDQSRFAISLEPGRTLPATPTDVIASGSA